MVCPRPASLRAAGIDSEPASETAGVINGVSTRSLGIDIIDNIDTQAAARNLTLKLPHEFVHVKAAARNRPQI